MRIVNGKDERIHKALAKTGIASRRAVERWIAEGRVVVNGSPAILGQKVSAEDRVVVDGRRVFLPKARTVVRVLLYKKRVGELVTRCDPEGRPTVFRKLPRLVEGRWIAVGRLDINTSGLLLLSNNGELVRRLTHPSFEIPREYAARVRGELGEATLEALRSGISLEDGPARFERLAVTETDEEKEAPACNHWLSVTVREGRYRLVRRLFESQGLQVSRLIRVSYGPIRLRGGQRSGTARELEHDEVAALCQAVDLNCLLTPPSQ